MHSERIPSTKYNKIATFKNIITGSIRSQKRDSSMRWRNEELREGFF